MFLGVKWEDEEPTKVELTIKPMADWRDKNIPEKCRDCEHCEKYTDLYTPYYMSYWKYSCKRNRICCKNIINN